MPIFRNASWGQRLYLQKSDGTAFNLTGIPLRMQFRVTPDAASPLINLTTTNGKINTTVNPSGGVIDLILSAADTVLLPKNSLYWDIVRTDTMARLCGGRALIDQVVTRD